MTLPAGTYQLEGISARAFQHPADRAATAALQSVPYLDLVVRKLIELGYERALRQAYLGSSVRLGQEQLPHIWALHRQVLHTLDIDDVPDLYLTQVPVANAATIGAGRPIVVVNSQLVSLLDEDGLRAVLAHEAGHMLSEHVLYRTALLILLQFGTRLPAIATLPLIAVRGALLEWSRAAELTSDRAAALVTRDPMVVCRTLMTVAAGAAAKDLNLDAFVKQGIDYDEGGRGLEKLSKLFLELNVIHPLPVRRVNELLTWVRGGEYDRIAGGDYVRRGDEARLREEADGAAVHYGDRIKDILHDAGESVGDIGDQLGDWLSRRSGVRD